MAMDWFIHMDARGPVAIGRVVSMSSPDSDTVGAFGHSVSPLSH